jgi:t-SNARE complex subunit (syntaxin)
MYVALVFLIHFQAQNMNDNSLETGDVTIVMEDNNRFMSDFFAQIDSLRTNIDRISEIVDGVKRLHSTILAAPQPVDRMKEELEEKMSDIKSLANDVRQRLKSKITYDIEHQLSMNYIDWRTVNTVL